MKIKFWGTRGSIPVPSKRTIKYGGNTPCLQVYDDEGNFIIVDAGSGIRELGNNIIKNDGHKTIKILISHTHWDHIQGLPFFMPLYSPKYNVTIYSNHHDGMSFDDIIATQWSHKFFPVSKEELKAKIKVKNISSSKTYSFGKLKVDTTSAHHSPGTLSFKFRLGTKTIVYMTDNEIHYDGKNGKPDYSIIAAQNKELVEFCRNCDYLIHDSMYTLKDYNSKVGWGHSNNVSVAYFAMLAEVKNLVLFHYEPDYTDNQVDRLLSATKNIFIKEKSRIKCLASRELLKIEI